MPIEVISHSHNIIIEQYDGLLEIEELDRIYNTVIVPKCDELAPDTLYIIHDVTNIGMDFQRMMDMFLSMKTRRESGQLLPDIQQIFVGTTEWLDSIRAWMSAQYGSTPPAFHDVQSALDYIKNQES